MRKFLRDCLTGIDCKTYDLGRVVMALASLGWLAALLVFLLLEVRDVVALREHFDMRGFGEGLGLVVAALTALHIGASWSLSIKAGTEPAPQK